MEASASAHVAAQRAVARQFQDDVLISKIQAVSSFDCAPPPSGFEHQEEPSMLSTSQMDPATLRRNRREMTTVRWAVRRFSLCAAFWLLLLLLAQVLPSSDAFAPLPRRLAHTTSLSWRIHETSERTDEKQYVIASTCYPGDYHCPEGIINTLRPRTTSSAQRISKYQVQSCRGWIAGICLSAALAVISLAPITCWAEESSSLPTSNAVLAPLSARTVPSPLPSNHRVTTRTRASKPTTSTTMTLAAAVAETTTAPSQPTSSAVALIDEVWELINKYYINPSYLHQPSFDWDAIHTTYQHKAASTTNADALAAEMTALLQDKYSRYLSASQYAAIQKYDLIGVGVTLMPDTSSNNRMIVGAPPVPGSEAARVGMAKGDWVTAINGVSTENKNAFDIIDQIGQDPNAPTITMRVVRTSSGDPAQDLVMQRSFTKVVDPVEYRLDTRKDGTRVGYIYVKEFNALVKGSLERALTQLRDDRANALVLDLRHNTGGAFQSAVEISGLFLDDTAPKKDKWVATYVIDGSGSSVPFAAPDGTPTLLDQDIPIVVWVDSRTASASEVLAGALHDNCRAIVMGRTPSFGKGWIQAVYGLNENGSGLVLTVARYVTPGGQDIQGVGIPPDISGPTTMLPLGGLVGGRGTVDTSTIDFEDVQDRLKMCHIPPAQLASTK